MGPIILVFMRYKNIRIFSRCVWLQLIFM